MLTNLKSLREERKISQQKLADAIGMSQSSINDYENRNIEPDITTLIILAEYFETSVDYIVAHTPIRRKIEDVSDCALNKQEAALVDGFRTLPATTRKIIQDLIVEIIKTKEW